MNIHIINGPNLNLLGTREPEVYGDQSFDSFFEALQAQFPSTSLTCFQSNIEGEIITALQDKGFNSDGIILNAGAYTHTSIGIGDAIGAIETSVIEVHISNIYARETYRHQSLLSGKCVGIISGLGLDSYRLAIEYFLNSTK
ncbi:MAG: 3-dehydroquinate dehydratase [Bacteroidetes bacterium]|nr:MAG: 3-dehydroquinate dehydratase [Bacteroidota bacterium]